MKRTKTNAHNTKEVMALIESEAKKQGLVNINEAVKILGLKSQTLSNYRSLDKGPPYYKAKGTIWYSRSELKEWKKANLETIEFIRVVPKNRPLKERRSKETKPKTPYYVLYCLDEGYKQTEIAEGLKFTVPAIGYYRKKFIQKGYLTKQNSLTNLGEKYLKKFQKNNQQG